MIYVKTYNLPLILIALAVDTPLIISVKKYCFVSPIFDFEWKLLFQFIPLNELNLQFENIRVLGT